MTSATGSSTTTTPTPTPSKTTPCAAAENGARPTPLYWLAALPRATYDQECEAFRRTVRLRRDARNGTAVPERVAFDLLHHDPESDDPLPEDCLYR